MANSLTCLSAPPVRIWLPSAERAIDVTPPGCAATITSGLIGLAAFFLSFLSAFFASPGLGRGNAQTLQLPSAPVVTSLLPSGCRATPDTAPTWTANSPTAIPSAEFQMRTLPWLLPATTRAALRLKAAAVIVPGSPARVLSTLPPADASNRTRPSFDPVASRLPSTVRAMTVSGPG